MIHKMLMLDSSGHSEFVFDDEPGGVALMEAEVAFEKNVTARGAAFAVTPTSSRKIKSLRDVRQGEDVLLTPQIVGG